MPRTNASKRELHLHAADAAREDFLFELFFFFVLFVTLQILYVWVECPLFSYVGYELHYDWFEIAVGTAIALAGFVGVYTPCDSIPAVFLYVYYYLSVLPSIVLYMYGNTALWMVAYQLGFLLLIRVLLVVLAVCFAGRAPRGKGGGEVVQSRVLRLFVLLFFAYMFVQNGVPDLRAVLFENVYEVRAQYSAPLLVLLVQNLMCKIVLPLMICAALERGQWAWFALACLVQGYVYAVTGFKTFLLIPLLLIGVKLLRAKSFKRLIAWGFPCAMLGGLLIFLLVQSNMFAAILFNRLVFLPAKIKECYFDFFSKNELVYFSQSTIASLLGVQSHYAKNVAYLIGEVYFNKPEMWTNCGFLADAFANLGVLGGFLCSAVLALELHLLSCAIREPARHFATPIFLVFFIALNDGGLISVSVSGGFLAAILLVLFWGKRGSVNE
ncbi:MAG: hypothetical protein J6U87_02035 [Clostridia bacterium]|nr:hypothetical protein [Clostridia bacterium]